MKLLKAQPHQPQALRQPPQPPNQELQQNRQQNPLVRLNLHPHLLLRSLNSLYFGAFLSVALLTAEVTFAAQEFFPFTAQVLQSGVNIRAGQSENFEKLGKLTAGDHVIVAGRSYSWYKIELPGSFSAFISAKYVQEIDARNGQVTTDKVNVRAKGDTNATVLGQLNKGDTVAIIERKGDWYQIKSRPGLYAWVTDQYVKFSSQDVARAAVQTHDEAKAAVAEVAEAIVPAGEKISLKGKLVAATDSTNEDIRFQIQTDSQGNYYLMGLTQVLGEFKNQVVKVEGKLSGQNLSSPVVAVERVELVL